MEKDYKVKVIVGNVKSQCEFCKNKGEKLITFNSGINCIVCQGHFKTAINSFSRSPIKRS